MGLGIIAADINIFRIQIPTRHRHERVSSAVSNAIGACGWHERAFLREFYMRDPVGSIALWLPRDQRIKPLIKKGALLCEVEVSEDGKSVLCTVNDEARLAITHLANRGGRPDQRNIAWSGVALPIPRKRVETLIRMRQHELAWNPFFGPLAWGGYGRPGWFYAMGRTLNEPDVTILRFDMACQHAAQRGVTFTPSTPSWIGLNDCMLTFWERYRLSNRC